MTFFITDTEVIVKSPSVATTFATVLMGVSLIVSCVGVGELTTLVVVRNGNYLQNDKMF